MLRERPSTENLGRAASLFFQVAGGVIAVSGLAHFAVPRLFHWLTRWLFGDETEKQVRINGAAETAVGLAIANRHTRVAGLAGLAAYCVYLGDKIIAYGWRRIQGGDQ
ncbi:hypothetical protein GOARA_012_00230 [Gordonia araii NBRC 100433]|uniref:Uncharacterized protein n=1 Tax=Gordonia araii NBRC 100433 TaxID=1073574 RepID=G7GXZ8_9ACTN|nr:hypothetical protein GOARA_012_00230 [Gordonia araii NBRC 100433]